MDPEQRIAEMRRERDESPLDVLYFRARTWERKKEEKKGTHFSTISSSFLARRLAEHRASPKSVREGVPGQQQQQQPGLSARDLEDGDERDGDGSDDELSARVTTVTFQVSDSDTLWTVFFNALESTCLCRPLQKTLDRDPTRAHLPLKTPLSKINLEFSLSLSLSLSGRFARNAQVGGKLRGTSNGSAQRVGASHARARFFNNNKKRLEERLKDFLPEGEPTDGSHLRPSVLLFQSAFPQSEFGHVVCIRDLSLKECVSSFFAFYFE